MKHCRSFDAKKLLHPIPFTMHNQKHVYKHVRLQIQVRTARKWGGNSPSARRVRQGWYLSKRPWGLSASKKGTSNCTREDFPLLSKHFRSGFLQKHRSKFSFIARQCEQDDNIKLPRIMNILKSWSISESPRKRAFLLICYLHNNNKIAYKFLKFFKLKQTRHMTEAAYVLWSIVHWQVLQNH